MPQPKFFPKAPTPVYESNPFEASYEFPVNIVEYQGGADDTVNLGEWFDFGGEYRPPMRAEKRRQVGYMETEWFIYVDENTVLRQTDGESCVAKVHRNSITGQITVLSKDNQVIGILSEENELIDLYNIIDGNKGEKTTYASFCKWQITFAKEIASAVQTAFAEQLAKTFAGNYLKWEGFECHALQEEEHPEHWGVCYFYEGFREASEEHCWADDLRKKFKSYHGTGAFGIRHPFGLMDGTVDTCSTGEGHGLAIKVYGTKGKVTSAFRKYAKDAQERKKDERLSREFEMNLNNLTGYLVDSTNQDGATDTTIKLTWQWTESTDATEDFENVDGFKVEWIKTEDERKWSKPSEINADRWSIATSYGSEEFGVEDMPMGGFTYDAQTDMFTFTITKLDPKTSYTYRITAIAIDDYRDKSVTGTISTKEGIHFSRS